MLHTLLIPAAAAAGILHIHIKIHTAQQITDLSHLIHINGTVILYRNPSQHPLRRLANLSESRLGFAAAIIEYTVELVKSVYPFHIHKSIPRQGEQIHLFLLEVHRYQDQRIRMAVCRGTVTFQYAGFFIDPHKQNVDQCGRFLFSSPGGRRRCGRQIRILIRRSRRRRCFPCGNMKQGFRPVQRLMQAGSQKSARHQQSRQQEYPQSPFFVFLFIIVSLGRDRLLFHGKCSFRFRQYRMV